MLGPSGSGKTTVLRLIAGFEQPTAGRIRLGDVDVTDRPPYDRDVNTVFQDYAIFPHLSVRENVEYGLRVKKVAEAERRRRARGGARHRPARGVRRPPAAPALRRPAAAGRAARALVNRPTGAAARRAARRARPQAARRDADRAQADPARGRHHLRVRHPRPGGGAHDERPDRRLQRGPGRAGGHAGRALRGARAARSSPASSAPPTCSRTRSPEAARRRRGPYVIRPEKVLHGRAEARAPPPTPRRAWPPASSARSSTSAPPRTRWSSSTPAAPSPSRTRTPTAPSTPRSSGATNVSPCTWRRDHLVSLGGSIRPGDGH